MGTCVPILSGSARRCRPAPHGILKKIAALERDRERLSFQQRRDGRVVEGARLESVYRGNSIEGSNPSLSAINKSIVYRLYAALRQFRGQRLYANNGGSPNPRTWPPRY